MPPELPYRDFYYPLNVFMYVLDREEGGARYLHYGLFESESDTIAAAQERSTELLLARLPPPPARVLEVGIGLGTTLAKLTARGYNASGITPDEKQIALVRDRFGEAVPIVCTPFESFGTNERFDCLLFQESSQYIEAGALFSRAAEMTDFVLLADEFALQPVDRPDALHSRDRFVAAATANGFNLVEEIDLSRAAAPTIDYFLERLPRYRDALVDALGLTPTQVDELIASGASYRDLYQSGAYGYRLMSLRRSER